MMAFIQTTGTKSSKNTLNMRFWNETIVCFRPTLKNDRPMMSGMMDDVKNLV